MNKEPTRKGEYRTAGRFPLEISHHILKNVQGKYKVRNLCRKYGPMTKCGEEWVLARDENDSFSREYWAALYEPSGADIKPRVTEAVR